MLCPDQEEHRVAVLKICGKHEQHSLAGGEGIPSRQWLVIGVLRSKVCWSMSTGHDTRRRPLMEWSCISRYQKMCVEGSIDARLWIAGQPSSKTASASMFKPTLRTVVYNLLLREYPDRLSAPVRDLPAPCQPLCMSCSTKHPKRGI